MEIVKESEPLAGLDEIAELRTLQYKSDSAQRLLDDPDLQPNDKFLMYLLALTLKPARAFNHIMTSHGGDPSGVEYKQPGAEKYAFVLPDASQVGRWRVSYFDKHGFSYHEIAPTMPKAAQIMVSGGFTEAAVGSLDRLAATKAWGLGVAYADLIMQLNMGRITHARFGELQADLNAQYQDVPESETATAVNDSAFASLNPA